MAKTINKTGLIKQKKLDLIGVTRTCYACGETKPIIHFKKASKNKHGYAYECLECSRARARKYVREHAEERNRNRREKYKNDKEWCEKEQKRNREYARNKREQIKRKYNQQNPYERAYKSVESRNKYKNPRTPKEFDISLEYVLKIAEKQQHKCALTGITLEHKRTSEKHHDAFLPSLDRINSDLGYIPGNVQWTTIWANRAKQNFTDQFFHEICQHTIENLGKTTYKYETPTTPIEIDLNILLYEPLNPININPKLEYLNNTFKPLRKCTHCGLEAWNNEELKPFVKDKNHPIGYTNICKQCHNTLYRKQKH